MPRIRSIKPEFWLDEEVAMWPDRSQLTYIGLWNLADDHGRVCASAVYIKANLCPFRSEVDIEEALRPIVESGKLRLYEHRGKRFGYLPKFSDHQVINRKSKPKYPEPPASFMEDDGEVSLPVGPGVPAGKLQSSEVSPGKGNGSMEREKEREGGDAPAAKKADPLSAGANEALKGFNEIWGTRRWTNKSYISAAKARLREGATVEELILVAKWAKHSSHERAAFNRQGGHYFPDTIWAISKFPKYLTWAQQEYNKPSPAKQTQMTEHTIDGRTCYEYATFPGWASGTHGWYRRESGGWVKATVAELNAAKEERTR